MAIRIGLSSESYWKQIDSKVTLVEIGRAEDLQAESKADSTELASVAR